VPGPVVAAAARAAASEAASATVGTAARQALLRRAFRAGAREAAGRGGGPSFFQRVRGSIWEIQGWDALFDKYLPRITHTVTVRAVGGKQCPLNTVVHLALATTFGCIRFEPAGFASSAIKVEVSHTANAVVVQYAYSTISALQVAQTVDRRLKRIFTDPSERRLVSRAVTLPFGPAQSRAVAPSLEEGMKQVGDNTGSTGSSVFDIAVGIGAGIGRGLGGWKAGPNVANVTPDTNGRPPDIPNNDVRRNKVGEENAKKRRAREDQRARMNFLGNAFGLDAVYDLGRTNIRASPPSTMLDTSDPADRPEPLKGMIGKVVLTRLPAANPQPPAAFGNDLRTLVAQALYDPGVRPPVPLTAYGPPTADPDTLARA
jgi:hypothetical protein